MNITILILASMSILFWSMAAVYNRKPTRRDYAMACWTLVGFCVSQALCAILELVK